MSRGGGAGGALWIDGFKIISYNSESLSSIFMIVFVFWGYAPLVRKSINMRKCSKYFELFIAFWICILHFVIYKRIRNDSPVSPFATLQYDSPFAQRVNKVELYLNPFALVLNFLLGKVV